MTVRNNGGIEDSDAPLIDADGAWTQVTQSHYDPESDNELTTAIVSVLAEAKGVSPTDLKSPPLYEVIDASALEATYFGPDGTEQCRQGVGTTAFRYNQCLVKVRSDGWIQVYETTDPDEGERR